MIISQFLDIVDSPPAGCFGLGARSSEGTTRPGAVEDSRSL